MAIHDFTIGRIRRADYAASARQLILDFDDGSRRIYTAVPEEVFRRLCHAPNPTTYWEDRIAEEYPQVRGTVTADAKSAKKKLDDLFG